MDNIYMHLGMKTIPARTVSLVILISLVTASLYKTKCESGSMTGAELK